MIYNLIIDFRTVSIGGTETEAITVNGSIPAPVLRFKEGKTAVIHVTNNMDEETSVHWHGLILPNYHDGVPYLTTPPIRPGETFTYTFPLKQAGTYWYHSHTGLQEQRGLYGGIIIEAKEPEMEYDRDLVLVCSDWTGDHPQHVLKNLKRHNEFYGIRLGNSPSLWDALKNGTLSSQLSLWADKMPGMHISDIPYDAFLINGKEQQTYGEIQPGETVRLRVINAAASSYFWLTRGGGPLEIIAADGLAVEPVKTDKVLIGIAETYDFLVTVPEEKSIEFRATAQDVTGYASAFLGSGQQVPSSDIPFPNYQLLGRKMAGMHSGNGGHSMELEADEVGTIIPRADNQNGMSTMHKMGSKEKGHMRMNMSSGSSADSHRMHAGGHMDLTEPMMMWDTGYTNQILKAKKSTAFASDLPVRRVVLNLTGNMWRYIWRINDVPLSAADKIRFNNGEVVQIVLNNTTMMHHPMHLHGHFFRVLNGNGDYSPLKHTVDIPPMSRTTIEFAATEDKDWFFHCHVLYHMSSGMARIFSYNGSERDTRLEPYALDNLTSHDEDWFFWGTLNGASHMGALEAVAANAYNQFSLIGEYGWEHGVFELKADYERFLSDYFRVYGGGKSEREYEEESLHDPETAGRLGMRYLLLYILDIDISLDDELRLELGAELHLPVTKRLMLEGHLEYKYDFGIIEELPPDADYIRETVWSANLEYILSESFVIFGGYDNRFEWGLGIKMLF